MTQLLDNSHALSGDLSRIIDLLEQRAPLAEQRAQVDRDVKAIDKEVIPALKETGEVYVQSLNKTFYASKERTSESWKVATLFRIFVEEGLTPLQVSTILGKATCKINEDVLAQTALLMDNGKLTRRCAAAKNISVGSSSLVGRKGE